MDTRQSFLLYVLILLSLAKSIQHMFVPDAFIVDLDGIRSSVVVDHRVLVVTGFIVGILLLISIPFLYQRRRWSFRLLFLLALFDCIGEFIAQGTLAIKLMVSFLVVTAILLILIFGRKRLNPNEDRLVDPGLPT